MKIVEQLGVNKWRLRKSRGPCMIIPLQTAWASTQTGICLVHAAHDVFLINL